MSTIAELLEASRTREQSQDDMIDMLRSSTAVDRLRFAVNICPILDKGDVSEAFSLLVRVSTKEEDPMLDAFKALNREDKLRATAKVLALVETDRIGAPKRAVGERRIAQNGEATATDLVLAAVRGSKVPLTRAQILAKVRETLPDVPDGTVQGVVSGKKADGTFRHHEEAHAYSMA